MGLEELKKERIVRVRELLKTAKHASMATTNEDGTPHATPFYLILDHKLTRIYFGSHPQAQHSQNIIRNFWTHYYVRITYHNSFSKGECQFTTERRH